MPLFWAKMGPKVRFVDLTSLFQDDILAIWLPDVRFHDVSDVEYLAQVPHFIVSLDDLVTSLSPSPLPHSLSLYFSFLRHFVLIEKTLFSGHVILSLLSCNQL
jgi:hypothetical protein